jgi:ubiquinone/menaquinone biosynthesis C-methylase UbiE
MIYNNYYDKYRTKNPVARYLTNGFLAGWRRMAEQAAKQCHPETLLETGCGDGYLLETVRRVINPANITVGLEPGIIDISQTRGLTGEFHAVAGSIYELPFVDNQFDLVIVPEVFEHLEKPESARQEVLRVARKTVIASVPWEPVWRISNMARGSYWKTLGNTPGHLQHFSRRSFFRFMSDLVEITDVVNPFPWTIVMGTVRK